MPGPHVREMIGSILGIKVVVTVHYGSGEAHYVASEAGDKWVYIGSFPIGPITIASFLDALKGATQ